MCSISTNIEKNTQMLIICESIYEQIMKYNFSNILPGHLSCYHKFTYDLATKEKYTHEKKLKQNLLKYGIIDFKFGKFGEYSFYYDSWYHQHGPGPYFGSHSIYKKGYYVYALYLSIDGTIYMSYQISNPHEGKGGAPDVMNWQFELFERPFLKFQKKPNWSYSGDMNKPWFDICFVSQYIISQLSPNSKIVTNQKNSQYIKTIFHEFADPEDILKQKYYETFENTGEIKKLEHGCYIKKDVVNLLEVVQSNMYKIIESIIELEKKARAGTIRVARAGEGENNKNENKLKKKVTELNKKLIDISDSDISDYEKYLTRLETELNEYNDIIDLTNKIEKTYDKLMIIEKNLQDLDNTTK